MSEFETPQPRRGESLLSFHTHHGARLCAQLDRLCLKKHLAAQQSDQASCFFTDRINRVMPDQHRSHRVGQRHIRCEIERIREHDLV